MGQVLRSIGAVFAGLLTVFALSEGTDFVLRAIGVYPPLQDGAVGFTELMFVGAFAYRTLAGVIGGFVTAAFAPGNAMTHALVLGFIGLAISAAGAVAMWGVGPAWYPIALAVVALPSAWLGGRLHQKSRRRAAA